MGKITSNPLITKRRQQVIDVENLFNNNGLGKDTFCLMPFVNIILEPNGSIGLCRHKGTEFSLGNIKEQSIVDIWNGPFAQKWRQEFLEGKPQICSKEIRDQHCNLCPELNKMFAPELLIKNPEHYLRLTANFNGKCNLQCQMCDVWEMPNGLYTELNFWEGAKKEIFPYLAEIDMLSGEPMIQADTFRLIDEVSMVNPNCLWSITTNAHYQLGKKITDALDKIKIKNLIFSLDSIQPDTYAKIRRPGNLSIPLQTIEDFLLYEEKRIKKGLTALGPNLNFVTQKDNYKEIKPVIDFCLERNIHPFITFCYRPNEHSLLSLGQEEVLDILNFYLNELEWDYIALSLRVITPLIDTLDPINKSQYLTLLKEKKEKDI